MCQLPNDLFLEMGDFNGSPNCYTNKALKGLRFRVFLDNDKQLRDVVQWDYLSSGGFQITIPGFEMTSDTLVIVQFY